MWNFLCNSSAFVNQGTYKLKHTSVTRSKKFKQNSNKWVKKTWGALQTYQKGSGWRFLSLSRWPCLCHDRVLRIWVPRNLKSQWHQPSVLCPRRMEFEGKLQWRIEISEEPTDFSEIDLVGETGVSHLESRNHIWDFCLHIFDIVWWCHPHQN